MITCDQGPDERRHTTAPGLERDIASFARHLRAANLSPKTVQTYLEATDQLARFLTATARAATLEGLRREDLEAFIADLLARHSPATAHKGQYLHPGKEHIAHAVGNLGEEAVWSLNTDAHLRSPLIGRSETIPIVAGRIELGEFGQIYFVDFDGVRDRVRTVQFQLLGE